MWQSFKIAFIFFVVLTVLTGVVYPLAVTGLARVLFSRQANGSLITIGKGKEASALIGQPFSSLGYFWGRPSATTTVPYNGAASAGSNLGPSSPALREAVLKRIAALKATDPENRQTIPVDLVTTSASGLDPHISPAAALYQAGRVARARGLDEGKVVALVKAHREPRQFGLLGEPRVSVLQLNAELDALR
jgi:K+-transporting ATPase ATPase C chain